MRKLLLLLALCCAPMWGAITKKSIVTNGDATSGTTIANTTSVNVAANDLIVVGISHGNSTANATSVVCGSDSLTRATSSVYTTENFGIELWYKHGASANAATTCTATWATAQLYRLIFVANYSGIAPSASLDQSSCDSAGCSGRTSSSTARTAQNVTTTQADELLVWISVEWNTRTWTAANSFVLRTSTSADSMYADKIVAATGSYPNGNVATITTAPDYGYLAVFATFKADTGGGGGSTSKRRGFIIK